MKQYLLAASAAALISVGLLFAADPKKDEAPKKPATQPTTKPAPVSNKFCPIEPEHGIDKDVTYVWNGRTYAFCCEGCIDEFKKNPEKYKNPK
jgi:hypothetical protein